MNGAAIGDTSGEYSVCQFFGDGTHEYVRRYCSAEEAVTTIRHYAVSVGARMGMTVRVIVTDGGDHINAEWKFGEGLTTYPTPEMRQA